MLILSRVCAEFHDRNGAVLFAVKPAQRMTFIEAPESIRQDPLFAMLLNDRSIEVADDGARRKQLENDPEKAPETESGKAEKSAAGARRAASAKC